MGCFMIVIMIFFMACSKKEKPVKAPKVDIATRFTNVSLRVLRAKIDDLSRKAREGRWKDFSAADRAMLLLGFRTIAAAGRGRGFNGSADALDHYLSGDGKEFVADPVNFRESPVVIQVLDKHYRTIVLKKYAAKETPLRIDPQDYGWLDTNLRYMMNPFYLYARDSLAGDSIKSSYRVKCHIKFYQNSQTLFFLAGDTLVFPDNLGVALESLGLGKPFDLVSSWQGTRKR